MESEFESTFTEAFVRELHILQDNVGVIASWDVLFLAFLRASSPFGQVRLGPVSIDLDQVEAAFERIGDREANDFEEFSRILVVEVRDSSRKRVDALHYLYAFMRCGKGIPARVFGELAVTPERVQAWIDAPLPRPQDELLTPEEVSAYLKVHVETVRGWIRGGRLSARRIAGLRALRIRRSDADALLHPLESTRSPRAEGGQSEE